MNTKLIAFAALAAGILAVGCTKHDPSYDEVVVPVVELKSITLTGIVTDKDGNPIAGASIDVAGKTLTTNGDGVYSVGLDASGDYTVTASATGKYPRSADISVELTTVAQTVVQNFVLSSVVTVVFTAEEDAEEETEYIEQNDPAIVIITGSVETDEEDAEFAIDLFYDESEITGTKAMTKSVTTEEMVLFGFRFRQTKGTAGAKATFTVSINKDVQDNVKVKKLNEATGQWALVSYESAPGSITIKNASEGYFAVFCDITKTVTSRYVGVTIAPEEVDNFYGTAPVDVTSISYTYYAGINVDQAQAKKEEDQMKALLLEKLAYDYGLSRSEINAVQPISMTVPVGIMVSFSGYQELFDITYSKGAKKAVAVAYGDVTVNHESHQGKHYGGGN